MGQPIFSLYHHIWMNTLSLSGKVQALVEFTFQLNYCRTQHHLLLFMVITKKGKFSKLVCQKMLYTEGQSLLFDDTSSNLRTLDTR